MLIHISCVGFRITRVLTRRLDPTEIIAIDITSSYIFLVKNSKLILTLHLESLLILLTYQLIFDNVVLKTIVSITM